MEKLKFSKKYLLPISVICLSLFVLASFSLAKVSLPSFQEGVFACGECSRDCDWDCGWDCGECGPCPPCPTPTTPPEPTPTPTTPSEPTPTPPPSDGGPPPSDGPPAGGGPPGPPGPPICGATVPGAPILLAATAVGGGQVDLSWTAVDPATHYSIVYGDSPGNYQYGVSNTGKVTSFAVGGLGSGVNYCFAVRAVNDCAPGELSNEICTGGGGQVLGVSTLADTGNWVDELYWLLVIMSAVCVGWGLRLISVKKLA